MDGERERVAEELRRVREAAREAALAERAPEQILPPPARTRTPEAPRRDADPAPEPAPARPDAGPVNALWNVAAAPGRSGLAGRLARFLRRLLAPVIDAQVGFNARQVQLDNELLAYLDARFDATHRHYDAVLGIHGRHMEEIDERHLTLQQDLVGHVHDLVQRIDLVLSEAERGRLSLEFALRDIRARLVRLEQRLPPG